MIRALVVAPRTVLLAGAVALTVATGCGLPGADYPRASADASSPLLLESDQEQTHFFIDGKDVGTAKHLRVLVNDSVHTVGAEAVGYRRKEMTIRPPYDESYPHSFVFMYEDRLDVVGQARNDGAPEPRRSRDDEPDARRSDRPKDQSGRASDDAAVTPAAPPPASPAAPPTVVAGTPQLGAYAVVVGVEHYRELPAPGGAKSDAERFARWLRQGLGIPAEHVRLALDDHATKSDVEKDLDWLKGNVPAGARVYFFFSGHGAPDASRGTPYLLPYDGDPSFLERTALPLAEVTKALSETKATEVLAFVDACFSGSGGRSVLPPGARPLVIVRESTPATKMAVFSAAQGAEISGPTPDGKSGLFSSTLLDGVATGAADADGDGRITLQELSDWVRPRVARVAKEANRDQHPSMVLGSGIGAPASYAVEWGLPTR
jgi:hypothetical protein